MSDPNMNIRYTRNPEREANLLASLLHDIGKFHYRSEEAAENYRELSAAFIEEHFKRFLCLAAGTGSGQTILHEAQQLCRSFDSQPGGEMLREAKELAEKDREKGRAEETHLFLRSIFPDIQLSDAAANGDPYFMPPGRLNPQDPFPSQSLANTATPDQVREAHREHWINFINAIGNLGEQLGFGELFDTLYGLLERYTARISCAEPGFRPDITLFDHLRVTAAYSDCLQQCSPEENEPFLVLEGDVSGIQGFIYKLANPSEGSQKGTAQTLRGRSLYVALLSESIADYLLEHLDLYKVHHLMNGGGHFHMLVPNTPENRAKVTALEHTINQALLKRHRGELGLVLATAAFSKEDISDYARVKRHLIRLLNEKKARKNRSMLNEGNYAQLFGPFAPADTDEPAVGEEKWRVCRRCESDYPALERKPHESDAEWQQRRSEQDYCRQCQDHREAGRRIPKLNFLIKVRAEKLGITDKKTAHFNIPELQRFWVFAGEKKELDLLVNNQPDARAIELVSVRDSDLMEGEAQILQKDHAAAGKCMLTLGFRFLGLHVPTPANAVAPELHHQLQAYATSKENTSRFDPDITLSFNDIADFTEPETYPLLHVLRMDVDSLGTLIAFGIAEKRQSIARMSNFSREMDLFFSGYINKLAAEHNLYITYSGGDDLFVVGKWHQVVRFARQLRQEFERFTCGNQAFSISGGALLVKAGHPIRKSAEFAGELEKRAKALRWSEPGSPIEREKNALHLFGEVHHWKRIEELLNWVDSCLELIRREKREEQNQPKKVAEADYRNLLRFLLQIRNSHFLRNEPGNDACETGEKIASWENPEWIYRVKSKVAYLLSRRAKLGAARLEAEDGDLAGVTKTAPDRVKLLAPLLFNQCFLRDIPIAAIHTLLSTRKFTPKAIVPEHKRINHQEE